MSNPRIPLTLISVFMSLSFLDGAFMWGLTDGFYQTTGFVFIIGIIWLWVIELRK